MRLLAGVLASIISCGFVPTLMAETSHRVGYESDLSGKLNIEERAEVDALNDIHTYSEKFFSSLGCGSAFKDVFWEETMNFLRHGHDVNPEYFKIAFSHNVFLKYDKKLSSQEKEKLMYKIGVLKSMIFNTLDYMLYELPKKYDLKGQKLVDRFNKERALMSEDILKLQRKLVSISTVAGIPGFSNTAQLGCFSNSGNRLVKKPYKDPNLEEARRKIWGMLTKQREVKEKQDETKKENPKTEEKDKDSGEHGSTTEAKEQNAVNSGDAANESDEEARKKLFEALLSNPETVASERNENIKGKGWHSSYSDFIRANLFTNKEFSYLMDKSKMASRIKDFCPNFGKDSFSKEDMANFYVAFFSKLAEMESDYGDGPNPRLEKIETFSEENFHLNNSGGRYKSGTRRTISEGLLQISVKEQFNYGCTKFDYFRDLRFGRPSDGGALRARAFTSSSNKSTFNPFANIECGMIILQKMFTRSNVHINLELDYSSSEKKWIYWSPIRARGRTLLKKMKSAKDFPACF